MVEERHTDQLDCNLAANVRSITSATTSSIVRRRQRCAVNRTEYYSEVKDLLGGDYWADIDKFAERDIGSSAEAYQNDLRLLLGYGSCPHCPCRRQVRLLTTGRTCSRPMPGPTTRGASAVSRWASPWIEVGYSNMYREGMWRKGLFPNNSKGDSKKLDYLTYDAKLALGYKFSGAHSIEANVAYMQQAPKFATAFVSPRTRNTTTPGLKAEKIFAADLTYNLNLPYIKARLSGYYTTIEDQSKVISFYDDTRSSFTNFAMSGIDKRYYGVELGLSVPVWNGLSVVRCLELGRLYLYVESQLRADG